MAQVAKPTTPTCEGDTWLPEDDRLPVEELRSQIPEMVWDRIQGSAVQSPPDAARLSRLNEPGPRLIEVGPIRSSVSLKLARRGVAAVELSH
jgi:hypothetical protein